MPAFRWWIYWPECHRRAGVIRRGAARGRCHVLAGTGQAPMNPTRWVIFTQAANATDVHPNDAGVISR